MESPPLSPPPVATAEPSRSAGVRLLWLILALGIAVRLFALANTHILNPDGALYIHQARAIHYGIWDAVNACTVRHLSLYPILIAGAYRLVEDWILSARIVSLGFGVLAIVPAWGILRRFFPAATGALATLAFALIPLFVGRSVDGIRDPAYWFFSLAGMSLFLRGREGRALPLLLGSASFLLATWTRIEAFVFFPATLLFLAMDRGFPRIRRLALFCAPLALAGGLVLLGPWMFHSAETDWHRLRDIPERLQLALHQYQALEAYLGSLADGAPSRNFAEYFLVAKNILWITAAGAIATNAMEAFSYPFFLLAAWGLAGTAARIRKDRRWLLFCLLGGAAFFLLLAYRFFNWDFDNRWLALLILPSLVFLGSGVGRLTALLERRPRMAGGGAQMIVCLLILLTALPQDLRARDEDKIPFRQIGEFIAARERPDREIGILTVGDSWRWISFYANLRVPGAPCPDRHHDYRKVLGKNRDECLRNLRELNIRYLVREGNRWPKEGFPFGELQAGKDIRVLGVWRRAGVPITLLQVRQDRRHDDGSVR